MSQIFVLLHEYEASDGTGDLKLIGVFSTEETAQAAIKQLRKQPGFKQHYKGFVIEACELDQAQWAEGFELDQPAQ